VIKKLFDSIFTYIAKMKIYMGNVGIYLGMLNFVLLLATFKEVYDINISILILTSIGLLGIIIIGYLDYNYIFLKQTIYTNKRNDIKTQLDRIEKILKNDNKKN